MRLKCAILDDYSNAALRLADWSGLSDRIDVTVFNRHIADQAELIRSLQGFAIVCIIRERTPFPRAVIKGLAEMKLLVTTGNRNPSIDLDAARECGVTVCGTGTAGNPTAALAIGLYAGTDPQDRPGKHKAA